MCRHAVITAVGLFQSRASCGAGDATRRFQCRSQPVSANPRRGTPNFARRHPTIVSLIPLPLTPAARGWPRMLAGVFFSLIYFREEIELSAREA
jgi:hypothetical protein